MADIKVRTPNFKFILSRFNQVTWHQDNESNLRAIDGILTRYFSIANYQGVWENATEYAVGDRVLDDDLAVIYECLVAHVSAVSPTTFSEDRIARPSYWEAFTSDVAFTGEWETATDYSAGDFVVSGRTFAIALTSHTSGPTFAGDVAAGRWQELIDGDAIVDDAEAAQIAAEEAQVAAELAAASIPTLENELDSLTQVVSNLSDDLDALELAFGTTEQDLNNLEALFPSFTGHGDKYLRVASGETAVEYRTAAQVLASIGAEITNLTADTAPAGTDELLLWADGANLRKIQHQNLLKCNILGEDTTPDASNDFLLSYDASASAGKKVKPTNLTVGEATKWGGATKTVSTSDPSGGSDGDIWIKYTA